ncbi:MAG: ERF family protein, partial [Stellaceae bacterium]
LSASSILDVILRAASDSSVDVGKMERLMAMHKELRADKAEIDFNEAMRRAQNEMRRVVEDRDNKQTNSKYASYEALDAVARPIYFKHGFSISFGHGDGAPDHHVRVVADVSHIGGHRRSYHLDIPADGKGPKGNDVMTRTHATVSAVTYGRRTLISAIFNLVVTGNADDDGNAADGNDLRIAPDQKQRLIDLQVETGADTPKFLKFFKIPSLDELPQRRFREAVKMLEAKKNPVGNK